MTVHRGARSGSTARTGLATLLSVGTLALSSCGVAGTDWQPGLAAEVGDEDVTTSQVDDYATDFCAILDSGALGPGVGVVARSELRAGIAGNLVRKVAAEQFAAEYGASPSSYYETTRNDVADRYPDASESERASIVDVQTADVYVNEIATVVGESTLTREGTSSPSPDESLQRGLEVFAEWLRDQSVTLDPSLGIAIADDGSWEAADSSTSVPASAAAVISAAGAADASGVPNPDYAAYVASLPSSQKCGMAAPAGG